MSKMKYSGEWIGNIPINWHEIRLKDIFDFEKGKKAQSYTKEYIEHNLGEYPVYSGQTENDGIMGLINSYDYDLSECLFTTTVGAKCMTLKILKGKFSLSQNCLIMQLKYNNFINKYMYYAMLPLFENERLKIPAYMQPSLRMEDINNYKIFTPNIREQEIIVNFLNEKVNNLDEILNKLNKQIEILNKYKKSVILETVTKGLDDSTKFKDTNVDWIGKIPYNWKLTKNKYQITIHNGREIEIEDGEIDVFGTGGLFKKTNEYLFAGESVLLGRKGTIDNPMYVNQKFWTVDTCYYTTAKKDLNMKLFYYFALCFDYKYYQTGSTLPSMTQYDLNSIYLPDIPIAEQKEIVEYLDKKCEQIDKIIKDKQKQIEKIEEYKKSVIYEYVTGKKRVEGAKELYG